MQGKHTPGPWFAGLEPHCPDLVHTAPEKGYWAGKLVGVGKAQPDGDFEEACANARLISAAPELLEALQTLVADVRRYAVYPSHSVEMKLALAAIAKARGEDHD